MTLKTIYLVKLRECKYNTTFKHLSLILTTIGFSG